ncbi:MAG: hypothetical protein AAF502_19770 [Bacteroidota bacterium]
MRLFSTKNFVLALSLFGFMLFGGQLMAESANNETPSIVTNCEGLSATDIDNYTTRFYELTKDQRALLNGMVLSAYGKKDLSYQKVHLDVLYKTVESYNSQKTREQLEQLFRVAGQ